MKRLVWVVPVIVLLFAGTLGMMGSGPARAAAFGQEGADTVKQIMDVQEKLTAVNRRIARETVLAGQASASERAAHQQNIGKLQEIKFSYQRQLTGLKKNSTVAAAVAAMEKSIESGQAFVLAEKKPYSLGYYDRLLDAVAAVRQEKEVLGTSLKNGDHELEESKKNLKTAEQTWRRVKEEVEAQKGPAASSDPRYIQAQLAREAAAAVLELRQIDHDTSEKEMVLADLKQKAAAQKLKAVRKDLSFNPAALDRELARLGKQKARLDKRIQPVLDEQKKVETEWQKDRATASTAAADYALKARNAWQETYETALQQTEDMTQWLNAQEKLWRFRYALLKGDVSQKELDSWEKAAASVQQQVRQAIGLYQRWQVNLQSRITSLETDQSKIGPVARRYAASRFDALKKDGALGSEYLSTLLTTGQLSGRLLDEIAARGRKIPLWKKVWASSAKLKDFWNFELWVIDGSGVTVRKVVTAMVILVLGIIAVKRAIRLLSARLIEKAHLEMSSAAAVEKLLLYLGFLLVILFALRTVNIPLTAFTFLGGAIAIGVGFGAQNLINNFISGFIIMAERPIRIGDLIELEGHSARVEEIGARCTRIKTGENIHILVPNSSFLEKNITNWTLSDQMVRAKVVVGVAYGSPVQRVTELLLEAVRGSELVLREPESFVIFEDFGDNALVFEVYFWVIVRGVMERKKIASDVRYRISEVFGEHGIVIAFPQRDVHVDSLAPLQVRLLGSPEQRT